MDELILGATIVLIIAICEGIKRAGVKSRYIPIIAIALGIGSAMYFGGASWLIAGSGIITALIASGLYSGFKKVVMNK